MEWYFTFQRAECPQFFVMIYSPYDEKNCNCAWHMCYKNTYAITNMSQHKGTGSIKNVKALLIYVLFLNSKHRNPYELSQLGQTVSVPEDEVWK
jgi:hypothetical protein